MYNVDVYDKEYKTDFTINEIRSFSFAKAERISNTRLHRIDELKSVVDSLFSEKGFKNLSDLKDEIIDSYLIEEEVDMKLKKKEMMKYNQKSFQHIKQILGGK